MFHHRSMEFDPAYPASRVTYAPSKKNSSESEEAPAETHPRPSRTWRDVRPESEMRRITDITERLLAVSINEYAPWRPPDFAGAEANGRDFHETFFILAFARDLSRAHRA
jgi:hypothetical protein